MVSLELGLLSKPYKSNGIENSAVRSVYCMVIVLVYFPIALTFDSDATSPPPTRTHRLLDTAHSLCIAGRYFKGDIYVGA